MKILPFSPEARAVISGNVLFIGLVSLFNDFASEMIYPLLPFFFSGLVSAAAAPIFIGLMDGVAESTSSLLKIYSGHLSDRLGIRKPIVVGGYTLSNLARPLTALATAGWMVVVFRFLDRVGKGFRTSPRDALVSDSVGKNVRGLAFSFQRLMDHAGAVAGPVCAAIFLWLVLGKTVAWQAGNSSASPEEMHALRWLFGISFIPGIIATLVLAGLVKEHAIPKTPAPQKGSPETVHEAFRFPRKFYLFLAAVVLFTLGNSSDLFLVFFAQSRFGLGPEWIIIMWIVLHLSKMTFSLPGGTFSDRAGRRPAIIIGWIIYVVVYVLMPFAGSISGIFALLIVYGAYYGMTEGAQLALVADYVPSAQRGRAYGLFHGAVGISALPASLLFGVFWSVLGAKTAFFIGASLAAAAVLLLYGLFLSERRLPVPAK